MNISLAWCPHCKEITTQETTTNYSMHLVAVVCRKCRHLLSQVKLPTAKTSERWVKP